MILWTPPTGIHTKKKQMCTDLYLNQLNRKVLTFWHFFQFNQSFPSRDIQFQLEFGQKTQMVGGEYVIGKAPHWPQDILWQEGEGTNQLQTLTLQVTITWKYNNK